MKTASLEAPQAAHATTANKCAHAGARMPTTSPPNAIGVTATPPCNLTVGGSQASGEPATSPASPPAWTPASLPATPPPPAWATATADAIADLVRVVSRGLGRWIRCGMCGD